MADDVIGSEDAVAEQARMFDTPGTPWYAVSKGTLEDIQKIWPATPCCRPHHKDASMETPCPVCGCTADVFARGPVGENVLHLAVLFHTPESVKMAKYLIERFGPSLVNAPYQTRARMTERPGLYEGEVALHIAIVHKDLELVRFMLQHGARLDTHTIGAFFGPGRVYFGETPFAFAASIGDRDIVKALLDHAAAQGGERKRLEVMTAVDAYGNTALHMCVKNNQLEMHDFLVDDLGFPEDVRNNAGMTPFIMAANDGNQKAFSSILRRRFSVVWTYGPVTNYSLSLADIDTVGADPHAHDSSVIDVILKKNHLALLNHPYSRRRAGYEMARFRTRGVFQIHSLLRRLPRRLHVAGGHARHRTRAGAVAQHQPHGGGVGDVRAVARHAGAARARPRVLLPRLLPAAAHAARQLEGQRDASVLPPRREAGPGGRTGCSSRARCASSRRDGARRSGTRARSSRTRRSGDAARFRARNKVT
jgi:ankyrin repeat protein